MSCERLMHHASHRAGTQTKTICAPSGGHNKIRKQSDKDFLSYCENDEVSADAVA